MRVLPKTVIYDAELTVALPRRSRSTSGINAIAHAAEGLYAQDANPVVSLMAEEGIRALAQRIRRSSREPRRSRCPQRCLYGAWLCGAVLGSVGMSLHHKLCHTLGGTFNLPHAETHTIVLPHALAYNRDAAPDAMKRIARATRLGRCRYRRIRTRARERRADCAEGHRHEGKRYRYRRRCRVEDQYWNPRPIEHAPLRALLEAAYEGRRP